MKNLCEDCKWSKLQTTNYCTPYEYDIFGNVLYCQSYEPEKRNLIKYIVNFVKGNDN
jgi:hypothetical protein